MKKYILIILAVVLMVGIFAYTRPIQEDYSIFFKNELTRAGQERVGQPIEGFSAFMYLEAFPGFEQSDFDKVTSLEGIYKLKDGELRYERTGDSPATSAEDVISDEGYKTLLKNFSKRVNIAVTTEADIATILEKLRERDVTQASYITDDYSIWYPKGWYPYENGPSVFFVRDAKLEIPQNTEGFALGPYFQITIHSIGVDELFTQNLWTEGSEFLVAKENVRIQNEEAIKLITKAAGAGGEVLHYVFESTDGRTFVLSHYPFERGSTDTNEFEQAVQTFMINYVHEGDDRDVSDNRDGYTPNT